MFRSIVKRVQRRADERRGAVTVEMAIIAPVLVVIIMGLYETSRLLDAQSEMAMAARVGARLATMDRDELLKPGEKMNDKVIAEVRGYLNSNGLPGNAATVSIVKAADHTTAFNLDDTVNDLQNFELRIEIPYSQLSHIGSDNWNVTAKVVFRNASASSIVQ